MIFIEIYEGVVFIFYDLFIFVVIEKVFRYLDSLLYLLNIILCFLDGYVLMDWFIFFFDFCFGILRGVEF